MSTRPTQQQKGLVEEQDRHFINSTLLAAGTNVKFDIMVLNDLREKARNANLKYKIFKATMEGNENIEILNCDTYTVAWLNELFGENMESTYNREKMTDVKITLIPYHHSSNCINNFLQKN